MLGDGSWTSRGCAEGCGAAGIGWEGVTGTDLGNVAVGMTEEGVVPAAPETILLAGCPTLERCCGTGRVGVAVCPWR
jgi:hypothetical protein